MKVDYKEIFKLKVMLDTANIPYEFIDRSYSSINYKSILFQIIVYNPNPEDATDPDRLISVIQGNGTHGAEQDLLEIMGCLTTREEKYDSVVGYLTAKEVYKRIRKKYMELIK